MTGFEADLPAIGSAAAALRTAADSLAVELAPPGDVGPGRLGPAVAALLATASADLASARTTVTEMSASVARVRDTYADLDMGAASRFDQGP
ncbi:hypothetical protein [Actinophytocola sp.]|uniref:hypothetical protein n=1 Tax=Actinophytocola sp. TaxID=1872138 RepID=UPI003899AAC9